MTALRFSADDECRMPAGIETQRVRVPCGCGNSKGQARSIPFQVAMSFVHWLRAQANPPGDMLVGSWYCSDCKWIVKVRARHLHFVA